MGICSSLCYSFNFVNMRFAVEIKFFAIKLCKKIYFHVKFVTEFYFLFFFSHMFNWMNKFFFTENNFLPRLINKNGKSQFPLLYLPKFFLP